MTTIPHLATLLINALEDPIKRETLIRLFQDAVAEEPEETAVGTSWETVASLATALEFYVPDAELRADHPSFYGDEELKHEIQSTLRELVAQGAIEAELLTRVVD